MRAHLLLGVAALSLGACKLDRTPNVDEPVQLTAGAPFQLGLAPAYDALPYAEPIPVSYAPQPVAYDYWNDAYQQNQTYYDQPPAYYNYGGSTPLVWTQPGPTGSGLGTTLITRIVEALIGGGQREYYYQPGQAYPYFVRDPQYAYAYDEGRLAMVYDPYGRPLQQQIVHERAPYAARYLLRADTLRDVALRTALRPLAPEVWTVQRTALVRDIERNDGWKSSWAPGANRSPVAIQRLAEVRARKEARDEAHDAWKAQEVRDRADRKDSGKTWVKHDDKGGKAVAKTDDHGGGKAKVQAKQDDHPKGHADKPKAKADAAGGKGKDKVSGPAKTHEQKAHVQKASFKGGGGDKAKGGGANAKGDGKDHGGGKKG